MNRCSVSIASNIAEGSGRGTNKDFNRFLDISLGSSYELETQLILAGEIFNLKNEGIVPKLIDLQRMIIGFKRSLN
jgi:four helix bundle protein